VTQLESVKFSFYLAARVRHNSSGSGFCFASPIDDSPSSEDYWI